MHNHIPITWLNDFIFCPYSIYLHNVYMSTDESLYHATPQVQGRAAHTTTDNHTYNKGAITALSVISNTLGIIGKIDLYKPSERLLVERKYRLNTIYKGQIYQLWCQYYCMLEMGYNVDKMEFYEISRNKHIPIQLPTRNDYCELQDIISQIRNYNPENSINYNINKCRHCIYCNLCDKTETENVYT